jgi:Protein of unknown function (DUF998)
MATTARHVATTPRDQPRDRLGWIALGAIAGPILFIVAWLVLGPARPGYSSIGQPISALAIGARGGYMRAAFLFNGVLTTGGVIVASRTFRGGLSSGPRWICTALLLLSPLGVLWDAVFTMDRLTLHTIGAQAAVGSALIGFPVAALALRRVQPWRRFASWLWWGVPLTLVLLIGFTTSVPLTQMATGGGRYGLWQRGLGIEVQAWYVAMGWLAFRLWRHRDRPVPAEVQANPRGPVPEGT